MIHKTTNDNIDFFSIPSHIKGKQYYLYAHTRNDTGDVFYFGIGTLDRGNYYRALCSSKRNIIWKRITAKTKYTVLIIDESDIKQEILDKEVFYISLMGKIKDKTGTLSNLTDGGEGVNGHSNNTIWTPEMRKKASIRLKNREIKDSTRDKLRSNIYKSNLLGRKGKDSYASKITLQIDSKNGNIIEEHPSAKIAANIMNVKQQSITGAIKKKTKSKGFFWRYKDVN